MSVLSPKAESLLTALASQPGVTQQHMDGLRDAITSSPALVDLFNDTLANSSGSKPELTTLGLLAPGSNLGAQYDPTTGSLNLDLNSLFLASLDRPNSGVLTFLFAHELEHARNGKVTAAAWNKYQEQVWTVAYPGGRPPRDYDTPLETYLNHTRWDEASAQVRGLNILTDRLQAEGVIISATELHKLGGKRTEDFFNYDTNANAYAWKPGYAPNADNTLTQDAVNQAAIDRHYYNKQPQLTQMGPTKHSDYPNYYGAKALQVIINAEQHAHGAHTSLTITVNLSRHGLRPELLHCNGIDLGGDGRVLAIQDTGDPNLPFYALPHHVPAPNVPHGLHGPAAPGRVAREHGFERVDHVLLSQATATQPAGAHVFLVQGSPDDPAHRRAYLSTAEAVAAPESQSLQRAQALEPTQQADHQLQAQQQEHSQQAAMRHH